MVLNWGSWVAFKPQPATVTQRKLTVQPTGAQKRRILHLQNHLMLHLLVQRLGTSWLGKSPAGREGGRPRVAVPGWMPPSRGDALHSGVGAAARPAERGMPLFPAAWSWEGHTVSSWEGHTSEGCPGQEGRLETGEKRTKNYQNYVTSKERLRLVESGEEDAKGQPNSSLKLF